MKKPIAVILSLIFAFFVLAGGIVIKIKANINNNEKIKYVSIANNKLNSDNPKNNPDEKSSDNIVGKVNTSHVDELINSGNGIGIGNGNSNSNGSSSSSSSSSSSINSNSSSSTNSKTDKSLAINTDKNNRRKNSREIDNSNSNTKKIFYSHKVVVLTYHHISKEDFSGITIKPERFEADLMMLREKGFHVISFKDMLQGIEGGYELPDNAVVITFDDGISSVYKYAFPLLKKYNVSATSFLITSRNQSYKQFTTSDNPLSPAEITQMYQSGLVDFQSHTNQSHEYIYVNSQLKKGAKLTNRIYNKYTKTYESNEEYINRVVEDLTKSRELIYKYTGSYADTLCFPFGIYNKEVIELAQKCGYKYFVTTQNGVNYQDSKKNKIYRIRAGDKELDSDKLYYSILGISK
jgi:peptidoglycan/xylan/chitin deacetylase (PgdA/CDA1 family)